MTNTSAKASIIDYWRAIELFSPQSVPRVDPNAPNNPVYSGSEHLPLPWHMSHPLKSHQPPPGRSRRYLVYCGVFGLEKVRLTLEDKLGKNPETFDERPDGETCLFAFSVTDEGRPLFDTFVLSTCAWATSRTIRPGPNSIDWLVGFDATASKVASEFAENHATRQEDERAQENKNRGFNLGRPLEYADILRETKRIAQKFEIASLCEGFEIRIKVGLVASSKEFAAEDQDFLNSFFVKDLGEIATEIRNNNLGKGLSTFLAGTDEVDPSKRINVRESPSTLFQQLSPALFAPGRWPSKGHHPLVFSQQFAVNSITQELMTNSGLFSVNGPPGTGKTTLLRDLIATVIVERAKRLSVLARPEDAFSGENRWKVGKYNRVISVWKEEFRGFEIVVASSNNGAVENVTLEIPGQESIDPSWTTETDYFPELATKLIGQPAWAMVAARLGKKANCTGFMNRFWHESTEGGKQDDEASSSAGFLSLLKSFEQQPTDWPQAVNRFKKALAEEQHLRNERESIFQTYRKFFSLLQELPALEKKLSELGKRREQGINQFHTIQNCEKACSLKTEQAKSHRLEHRQFHPGIFEILLSLGKAFREWRQKDTQLAAAVKHAEHEQAETRRHIASQAQFIQSLENEIQQVALLANQKRKSLIESREKLDKAKNRFGSSFPIPGDWANEHEARELSSPWADPEWNNARAKVFLEALQLQKSFVTANAGTIRKSLWGAMDILSGSVPDTVPREAVEAAWTTLFFVVPVISTTFASFARLFSHLGRESIGWLLIDEAGQAIPQAAIGAIWRSKRSVVVGDPLQLEPVVTIPLTVQESLRKYYQVEETWIPGSTSVQQLADRVSRFGTYLSREDGPIWVGSPLLVHRRCDQPMFDISNKVAYNGLMVFGTPSRLSLDLPPSSWVDVTSNESEGHWIPAEGHALEKLLTDIIGLGVQYDDIFLITPFRDVKRRLHQISSRFGDIEEGTIHTVQGKEADVVILVLGGDPNRPGAKQWASARPNLLNVAASRAKRRLYVIGNRDDWKKYRYFSVCTSALNNITF